MQEIPFILTEWQELNSLLYIPLSATKRVQYTCIAVSANYIILGATSGSIYLFTRESCTFQQLIPLSEGAVSQAQISPDEKAIALATVRGSVCLVVLKPNIKLMTVSTEHLGEKVTCLCWNDNSTEVYAGDEKGQISVCILSTFKVNGIFQSLSCTLMNLDSKIVQMNSASSLLLISTLNRCYICDTVLEQYKQIGNKPRDGEFGACFFKTWTINTNFSKELKKQVDASTVKKVFHLSGDNEIKNGIVDEKCLPKVYCARPGSRLWEVTASGIVNKTHQFKEALAIAPLPIYKPSIGKIFKLKNKDQTWSVQSINFAQLSVISHKYLFSYTSNGIYIFDPENAEVILWNDEFPDIFMTQIIDDNIYLMTSSGVFHCLTLVSNDSLILKLYDKKLYKESFNMCQLLKPELINSSTEKSCDIDIKESNDISKKLAQIISVIKLNYNTKPVKLESGIVIVNSGNRNFNHNLVSFSNSRFQEIQTLDESEDLFISCNINEILNPKDNSCEGIKNGSVQKTLSQASSLQTTICNLQTDLEILYSSISSQMKTNMTEKELQEILKLFIETLDNIKEKYEVSNELQSYLLEVIHSAELNYCNSLLENLSIPLLCTIENEELLNQIAKLFIDVNSSKCILCSCGISYPVFGTGVSKTVEPKFFDIGKILLNKLLTTKLDKTALEICNQIPYMWRDYLHFKEYAVQDIPNILLKRCLQTRDNLVLSIILFAIEKHQWKIIVECFHSIKIGRCINCNKPYDNDQISVKEFTVDWFGVTHNITQKFGVSQGLKFLVTINEHLPEVVFEKSIYQSIIFSTILNQHGLTYPVELNHTNGDTKTSICSPRILQEITPKIEKDLEKPVNKYLFGSGPYHWGMRYNLTSSICPCCTLSLHTPVLLGNNGIALFPCGHAYHVNCMIQKKMTRCNLHIQ